MRALILMAPFLIVGTVATVWIILTALRRKTREQHAKRIDALERDTKVGPYAEWLEPRERMLMDGRRVPYEE